MELLGTLVFGRIRYRSSYTRRSIGGFDFVLFQENGPSLESFCLLAWYEQNKFIHEEQRREIEGLLVTTKNHLAEFQKSHAGQRLLK